MNQNVTVEDYQKHQLQHKKRPRDLEVNEEHGSSLFYRMQHDDNPNDTCNDFYLFLWQNETTKSFFDCTTMVKTLRWMLNSLSNEFPISSIECVGKCFHLG